MGDFAREYPAGIERILQLGEEECVAKIQEMLISPESFTADYISEHIELFRLYFSRMEQRSANTERMLEWLVKRLPIEWVNPYSECQKAHARFAQTLEQVKELLAGHVGQANVDAYLQGNKPRRVYLRNRVSVAQHTDFVRSEIETLFERRNKETEKKSANHSNQWAGSCGESNGETQIESRRPLPQCI